MPSRAAERRIAINVALDGALAASALVLAGWLAAPAVPSLPGFGWLGWGVAASLLAGLPFRLPLQYWRFTGMADLLGVAAASVTAATLFTLGLQLLRVALPSAAFPVLLTLTLVVLLGLPRMTYRMLHERRPASGGAADPVLLVGAGEGADLFLRALAADPLPAWRAVGLLSLGSAQTGRRMHGCPILGSVDDAPAVLAALMPPDRVATLVVTEPDLPPDALAGLRRAARQSGARIAHVPRPTALTPAEL